MGFNESSVQRPERNLAVGLSGVMYCLSKPDLDISAFETELQLRLEDCVVENTSDNSWIFRFPAYAPFNGRDQKTPYFVLKPLPEKPEFASVALGASPDLTFSRQLANQCQSWFSFEECDSIGLDHMNRLHLFNQCLESIARVVHPILCYFPQSQALWPTPDLLEGLGGDNPHLLAAVVSLVASPNDSTTFQTLGLASLGLSDFRFTSPGELSDNDQAELLWNYAYSAYQNGDVWRTGSWILGPHGPQSYLCERSRPGGEGTPVMITVCNSNK